MNFFQHQKKARSNSFILIFLFLLSTLLTALAIEFICTTFFHLRPFFAFSWVLFIILAMSGIKYLNLKKGGSSIAEQMGGEAISFNSIVLNEKKLINIVSEMSIASGVSMPQVYVLRNQKAINAFAAGFSIHDAVICVTEGAIEKLNREELQAVIAHEFSHIFNGDMKLNMNLIGILSGILVVSQVGRSLLRVTGRGSSRRSKGGGAIFGVGLVFFMIGMIGYIFGKIIKSALSRQREFLADASAVQFTRNPGAVSSVLKKILVSSDSSYLTHKNVEEFSHLFFSEGEKNFLSFIFSTHPSLEERIKKIEPHFNIKHYKLTQITPPAFQKQVQVPVSNPMQKSLQKMDTIGLILEGSLLASHQIMQDIPEKLKFQCGDTFGAQAIVFTFAFHDVEKIRMAQWEKMDEKLKSFTIQIFLEFHEYIKKNQLLLFDLCVPTLQQLSMVQQGRFIQHFEYLVKSDQKVDPIEYVILVLIEKKFQKKKNLNPLYHYTLKKLKNETLLLTGYFLFILNHKKDSQSSYEKALSNLNIWKLLPLEWQKFDFIKKKFNLEEIKKSLWRLSDLPLEEKRKFLKEFVTSYQDEIQPSKEAADFLRAVSECFEIPLPPF